MLHESRLLTVFDPTKIAQTIATIEPPSRFNKKTTMVKDAAAANCGVDDDDNDNNDDDDNDLEFWDSDVDSD